MKTQIKLISILLTIIITGIFNSCSNENQINSTPNTSANASKNANATFAITQPQLQIDNQSIYDVSIGAIFAQSNPNNSPTARMMVKGIGLNNTGFVAHNSYVKFYNFNDTSDNNNLQPQSYYVTNYIDSSLNGIFSSSDVEETYGVAIGNGTAAYWSGLLIQPNFAGDNNNTLTNFYDVNGIHIKHGFIGESTYGTFNNLYNISDSFEFTNKLKAYALNGSDIMYANWNVQPNGTVLVVITGN